MLRPCLQCGVLSNTSRCPRHGGASRNTPGRRGGSTSTRYRAAVLAAAGCRCQFINDQGARCTATIGLEAHHQVGLRQGGSNDPAGGIALCRKHHGIVERSEGQPTDGWRRR